MDNIDKLTEIFKEFPGIGVRQAKRFVYFLMSRNGSYADNLAKLILEIKKEVAECKECYRFFLNKDHGKNICDLCENKDADDSLLMVTEKDSDLESVRKSKVYNGRYFVLGGLVPIIEKNTKNRVRVDQLLNKIKNSPNLKELILAFSLSPQGDHTDHYIRGEVKEVVEKSGIKVSSLGRGLSTGTELEYSDNETLKNALKNRQ